MLKANKLYVYALWGALFFDRSVWINYLLHQNYNAIQIGLLQTLLTLAMFLGELPSGVMADRIGPKKTMAFGHILIIIYLALMLVAFNYATLIIGFIAYGLGLSMISGSDQTLIYESNTDSSYQHKIGIFEAVSITGLMISSLIGGYLTTLSWSSVFIVAIIAQILAMVFLSKLKMARQDGAEEVDKTTLKQLFQQLFAILQQRKIRYLVLTISIFQSAISVLFNFGQLFFANRHFTTFQTATVLTVSLGLSAVASTLIERLSNKMGQNRTIWTFFILTIAMLLMLKSPFGTLIILGYLVIEFSFEIVDVSLNVVVQELSNDTIRTSLVSSINTLTAGLMFFETMIVSGAFSKFGITPSFVIFGVLTTLLAVGFYLLFLRQSTKRMD